VSLYSLEFVIQEVTPFWKTYSVLAFVVVIVCLVVLLFLAFMCDCFCCFYSFWWWACLVVGFVFAACFCVYSF